jgi:nucleoside-diphosphate-sugar epimerase
MTTRLTVLLVGGTGRTGSRVLEQLLGRGVAVRAIVRSRDRLPPACRKNPDLAITEADLLSLSDEELRRHVDGCDAIVSCLGHVLSLRGIFGRPRDLVTRAATRLCRAIESVRPAAPIRLVLMSSVSVHRTGTVDARRSRFERAFLWVLCRLLPPAHDNQRAADFLADKIGTSNPYVEWVAVRPDTLLDGDVSGYTVHDGLVTSLFRPDHTRMANVAHFQCELATDSVMWDRWKGRLPVIVDTTAPMS